MSLSRLAAVIRQDLRHHTRRPLFWIWILLLGLMAFGLSDGNTTIQSGDSTVGGTKSWITSEYANAMIFAFLVPFIYTLFIAVAAGMTLIRDSELRVTEILYSTPLRPWEYIWGKFLAALLAFVIVLGIHLLLTVFFNHGLQGANKSEMIGPFVPMNYLKPALLFGVPALLFIGGTSFAVGERTRRPILVFFLPVAVLLTSVFVFWVFTPSWLDPRIDALLMGLDPTGVRWLNQTHLTVDRGVDYYNTAPIQLDWIIISNRIGFSLLGILAVVWAQRHFTRTLRGVPLGKQRLVAREPEDTPLDGEHRPLTPRALGLLPMRSKRIGFLRGLGAVLRTELRELRGQPGLYLFVPLIILETVASGVFAVGAFDTRLLATSGSLAREAMPILTFLLCLLLMFYMVESLRREASTQLSSIFYATPLRTTSVLLGKALANAAVALVIVGAALASCWVVLLVQKRVAFEWEPFLVLWGVLLVPTLLLWTFFVAAVYSGTRNAYTTYAASLGVLIFTGYKLVVGEMSWVWNWTLWGSLRWSDMGLFELDREALIWNRMVALGGAVFFLILAVKWFPRRSLDANRTIHRLRPRPLLVASARLLPFALLFLVPAAILDRKVDAGYRGEQIEKKTEDYWRQNVATWLDAPNPDIASVSVDLTVEPESRSFEVTGNFELANGEKDPLRRFALTGSPNWSKPSWTMDGEDYEPEARTFLYVFTPKEPLAPGQKVEIGFSYRGEVPHGLSKNGEGAPEFILPSGIVLTSFRPSFVPVVGFQEGVGVDEDNSYESKEYKDDFFEGFTPSGFGTSTTYPVRVRITAPEEYTMNSVGILVEESVADGLRTVQWETDQPVSFFNVVGGRWDVRRGEGTAIYYHPEHDYNIDAMIAALDASRKHYSQWFHPFPWEELKLSEFPAMAGYAQGFPTNITFSEGIGFLSQSDPRVDAAFFVTAHEAAHQWWGNILVPGEGPGANILSEGTAHFSTILLQEEVKGPRERIEFCRRLEERYGEERQVDSERPLVKIEGDRPGDTTVTYDKGGWVFWMLMNHMGREEMLQGIQSFIAHYSTDRDHPVLQDFIAHLRTFAPQPDRYDQFVGQWFFEVVVPEYRLDEVGRTKLEEGGWQVELTVRNIGTGQVPVQVAATRGERFPDTEEEPVEDSAVTLIEASAPTDGSVADLYRESRVDLLVGPDEERHVSIHCDFEPEKVLVDPDAKVLMLRRKLAEFRF